MWQFDFSEYETIKGGTWRVAGIADYWSKYEFGWHWSATANQFDAITAVELAITEAEKLLGHRLADLCRVDERTGELLPATTLVTDNGGPFKSFRFGAFITAQPALQHVRTKAKSPRQNGVRERAFGSLKYERLYLEPSTTRSTWSVRPKPSGSTSTPSGRTRRWPGTAPTTSTSA